MSRSSQYQATIGGRRVGVGGGGRSRCTQALEQVAPRLAPEQQTDRDRPLMCAAHRGHSQVTAELGSLEQQTLQGVKQRLVKEQ